MAREVASIFKTAPQSGQVTSNVLFDEFGMALRVL
jgi:hypothetical protein